MATSRDLKRRIASIGSTAQITKAMQMVSASKMQKAQDKAKRAIPYSLGIYEIVSKFSGIKEYKSVFLQQPEKVKNVAIVVIGSNRGFVGGMIANITSAVYRFTKSMKEKDAGLKFWGISVHKTGLKILNNAGINSDYHFQDELEQATTTDLTSIFSLVTEGFSKGKYDEVYIAYSHFVSTLVQKPVIKKILPISWEGLMEEAVQEESQGGKTEGSKEKKKHNTNPFLFEPSMEEVLDRLLPEYFQTQIYTAILEGLASEHSARMISMKNATDNANGLKSALNIKYNRQRQAGITQELIEVINGS
jgi:F-type H+-transporting ATPase subunit gamma